MASEKEVRIALRQARPDGGGKGQEIAEAVLHDIPHDLEVHARVAVNDDVPKPRHSAHGGRQICRQPTVPGQAIEQLTVRLGFPEPFVRHDV